MSSESEARSRGVAEAARETEWKKAGFMRDLFLGSLRLNLVYPYPDQSAPRPEFKAFYDALRTFLVKHVDPVAIDATGEYPREVIDGLAKLGAFGLKIPREYGGLGFARREYETVTQLIGSHDSDITPLLSAHASIGVPQRLN